MTTVQHRYFIKLKGAPLRCYASGKSLGTIPLALTHEEVRTDNKGIQALVGNAFIREVDCHGHGVRSDDDERAFRRAILLRKASEIQLLDRKGRQSAYAAAEKDDKVPEPEPTLDDPIVPDVPAPSPVAKALAEEAELQELLDKVVYVDDDAEEESVDEDPTKAEVEAEGTEADDSAAAAVPGETYDLTLLDQSVKGLKPDIEAIEDEGWLRALLRAETDGKTRKTVIAALNGRLDDLEG